MAMPPLTSPTFEPTLNQKMGALQGLKLGQIPGTVNTSQVVGVQFFSAILSPVLIAANTTAEQTFTVNGLILNSVVWVNKPTAQAGLGIVGVRVSATDQIGITFSNNTGGNITPTAAEKYLVCAMRSV